MEIEDLVSDKNQEQEQKTEQESLVITEKSAALLNFKDKSPEDALNENEIKVDSDSMENKQEENESVTEEFESKYLDREIESSQFEINNNMNLVEIGRCSWKSCEVEQRYLRGCLWSPDGTCVLAAVNGEGMQIFELPLDLYTAESISKSARKLDKLIPAVVVQETGTVYDYNWFPHMNSNDPATCCWIASRQHEPIHMFDAFTGELRCTYRGYDQFDEVETAISLIFSPDGETVIGGYKKSLKIFQTSIPGRSYTEVKSKNAISAFAMHSNHPDMIISGSWNSTINIFDKRVDLGCLTSISGHSGGVTLLKFDLYGEKLFSGARKDNSILEWDLRNFALPVRQYKRNVLTNQRIYFDISPCNKYLFTGGADGILKGWNINEDTGTELQFELHKDCCNAVGFSGIRPVMCTTSGQYKFPQDYNMDVCGDIKIHYENSLILWWYGNCEE